MRVLGPIAMLDRAVDRVTVWQLKNGSLGRKRMAGYALGHDQFLRKQVWAHLNADPGSRISALLQGLKPAFLEGIRINLLSCQDALPATVAVLLDGLIKPEKRIISAEIGHHENEDFSTDNTGNWMTTRQVWVIDKPEVSEHFYWDTDVRIAAGTILRSHRVQALKILELLETRAELLARSLRPIIEKELATR